MTFRLVWENVRYRPVRTLLSVLLIAVPVTLILVLVGISNGLLEDSSNRARGINADIAFRAQGSSLVSLSGGMLPAKFVRVLGQEPHVVVATGVFNQPVGSGIDSIAGIDPAAFDKMSGGFTFIEGHTFEKPDDILLDQYYANQNHVKVGSTMDIVHRKWHVAGIVEPENSLTCSCSCRSSRIFSAPRIR